MQLLPWGYFPLARVFSFSQKFSGTPLSIRGKVSSHSGEESHNRRPASMFHVVRGSLGFLLRPPPAETDISARICSTSPLQSLSGSSRVSFGFELCSTFVHTEKKRMPESCCHAMFGLPLVSTTLVQMTFQMGWIERFSLKLNKCANGKKRTHLCECCCRSLWSEPPAFNTSRWCALCGLKDKKPS